MERIEANVLRNLVFDEDYSRKVIPFIQPDYFEQKTEKVIFEEIVKFIVKYGSAITIEALNIEIENRTDLTEEQVKEIVALRENMLQQVDKHQEGIDMLEKNITVLDEFLKDSSFIKASKLKTQVETEIQEKVEVVKPAEDSIPIKRGSDGKVIANAYVTPEQVSIILDEQVLINADTPPFKSFFLDRIIGEMP